VKKIEKCIGPTVKVESSVPPCLLSLQSVKYHFHLVYKKDLIINERLLSKRLLMSTSVRRILAILTIGIIAIVLFFFFNNTEKNNIITLYGNIDIRQVELSFHDPEHIAKILVEEGDKVEKGQLLAEQDLERFQYQLEKAKAQTEAQQQVVLRLVRGSRPEEIRRLRDEVKALEAEVRFDEKEYQRVKKLVKRRLTSVESVDRAYAKLISNQQKLAALKEQYRLAVIGPREEDITQAKAVLKAFQSDLKLAEKALHDAHIYAPNPGIIQDRILEPGDMANLQTPVMTLALTNPLWARVYIPESQLGQLKYGMPATIHSDSYPDKSYTGWVGFISPTAEFTPKTVETPELRTSLVYQVRVYVCNPQNELRLGMPVTVTINKLTDTRIKKTSECSEHS
jgi:HlyD family secretion protein